MDTLFEETTTYNAYLCDIITKLFFSRIRSQISLLDFGCGKGLLTHFMHRAFFNASISGADKDISLINKNKKKYPEISFIHLSGTVLPFENNTFDLIYAVNVLHHITHKDRQQICNELVRILNVHGSLLIFEFNPFNLQARKTFKHEHGSSVGMIGAKDIRRLFTTKNLTVKTTYLYPNLATFEQYVSKIPFGLLYYVHIIKNKPV